MDRVFLMKKKEFVLLAAAAGIHQIYGFDMQAEDLERKEAIQCLMELTEKEYLRNQEGHFFLTEEMEQIFSQIKHAGTVMEIHKKTGRKCILYMGNCAVRMTQSLRRKDCYELQKLPVSGVWQQLMEEGWITDSRQDQKEEGGIV